jgi:hypothetical protein
LRRPRKSAKVELKPLAESLHYRWIAAIINFRLIAR